MSTSPFRLEGLIPQNEFLDRPRHKAPSIDDDESIVIIDDAIRVDYEGHPKRGDYRIGVHLADGGLLYGHHELVESIRQFSWRQPNYMGDLQVSPDESLTVNGTKKELSLRTDDPDGAPSLLINYSYNSHTRSIGGIEFSEARVLVDSYSAKEHEVSYDDERQARKLDEVAAGINQPVYHDLDASQLNSNNKVAQIMIATNRIVAREVLLAGIPWIYKNKIASKPHYGTTSEGHTGIGIGIDIPAYCHATSPLQYFTDLVNHLNLRAHMRSKDYMYEGNVLKDIVGEQNEMKNKQRQRRSSKVAA